MGLNRFIINTEVENGQPHYKITDIKTGDIIRCDMGELTSTLNELID